MKKLRKKACIFISSEYKGLYISFVKILEEKYNYDVTIICRDKYVKKVVTKILGDRDQDVIFDEIRTPFDRSNIYKEASKIESTYGFNISMLMSEDRALGQGYLHNVEKVPDIIRASWSHEKKLEYFIESFKKYEQIFDSHYDLLIQKYPNKVINFIAKKNKIRYFSLLYVKFENRIFWSDHFSVSSSKYQKYIKSNLKSRSLLNDEIGEYSIDQAGNKIVKTHSFSYLYALKRSAYIFWNDTKNWIRGMQNRDSYRYLGWLPTPLNSLRNYEFVKKHSVNLATLKDLKIIYFPLQMEPEVSMLFYSPEFSNSLEALSWISKNIKSDTVIIVKEQVKSYAVRSRWFYKQLIKMPNVYLSHPEQHSWKIIENSIAVATITGTAGIEAIHHFKPVLSFGKHQIINNLPTVFYCNSFDKVKEAIDKISNGINEDQLKVSSKALIKSQIDVSFDFPEYNKSAHSSDLDINSAEKALFQLDKEYSL